MTRPLSPTQTKAIIDLDAIRHNYRVLYKHARTYLDEMLGPNMHPTGGWPLVLPVVKADAYGHGVKAVVLALLREKVEAFTSGGITESVALQDILTQKGAIANILSLLGAISEEEYELAHKNTIICALHSFEQLDLYSRMRKPLQIAIKCNSGMGRLGFTPDEMPELLSRLRCIPWLTPELVFSHLAVADEPSQQAFSHQQADAFQKCVQILRLQWPDIGISLGNSAGLLDYEVLHQYIGAHTCRPGLALYGINPFPPLYSRSGDTLRPVMEVTAPVISCRNLATGEPIGYGLTFHAPKPMRIALVGIGYAHGYPRLLSNKGSVCILGERCPIVGRVCMQMTAVDISDMTCPVPQGTIASVLGGAQKNAISAIELAEMCDTIPYELTCSLGKNMHDYKGQ